MPLHLANVHVRVPDPKICAASRREKAWGSVGGDRDGVHQRDRMHIRIVLTATFHPPVLAKQNVGSDRRR
jgi:hypothetical protein